MWLFLIKTTQRFNHSLRKNHVTFFRKQRQHQSMKWKNTMNIFKKVICVFGNFSKNFRRILKTTSINKNSFLEKIASVFIAHFEKNRFVFFKTLFKKIVNSQKKYEKIFAAFLKSPALLSKNFNAHSFCFGMRFWKKWKRFFEWNIINKNSFL